MIYLYRELNNHVQECCGQEFAAKVGELDYSTMNRLFDIMIHDFVYTLYNGEWKERVCFQVVPKMMEDVLLPHHGICNWSKTD